MNRAAKLQFIVGRSDVVAVAETMIRRHGADWLTDEQVDQIYEIERQISELERMLGRHHGRAAA